MSDNIFKLSNTSGTTTMYMLTVDAREYEINGGKYSGNEISVDGKKYLIMHESDIFAIIWFHADK